MVVLVPIYPLPPAGTTPVGCGAHGIVPAHPHHESARERFGVPLHGYVRGVYQLEL